MNDRIKTRTGSDLSFSSKLAIELLNVIVVCVIVSETVSLSASFTSLGQRIQIDKKFKVIQHPIIDIFRITFSKGNDFQLIF